MFLSHHLLKISGARAALRAGGGGDEEFVDVVSKRRCRREGETRNSSMLSLGGGVGVHGRLRIEFQGSRARGRRFTRCRPTALRALGDPDKSTFLSLEEAGLIEMSDLDMHERFLARLTVSSLNLLRVISEQEGLPIEDLNAGRVCDWFVKDKAKRATDIEKATLKWDAGPEW